MHFNRRQILTTSIGAAAMVAAPGFLQLARASDGFFELTAGKSKKKLYREDAPASDLWTYNESSPGPEIRVKRGERVRIRLINNLEEPTSIHWHGIRIMWARHRPQPFHLWQIIPASGCSIAICLNMPQQV